MPNQLFVYLNGDVMEESRARISPFDRGFLMGDGVYEITGCFNRRLYRLNDHLDRLYRSLRYVGIDPGIPREEIERVTIDLLKTNLSRLKEEGVYRVGHWVARGMDALSNAAKDAGPPTVFIFFRRKAPVPGPITQRLIEAFAQETGFDYSKYISASPGP